MSGVGAPAAGQKRRSPDVSGLRFTAAVAAVGAVAGVVATFHGLLPWTEMLFRPQQWRGATRGASGFSGSPLMGIADWIVAMVCAAWTVFDAGELIRRRFRTPTPSAHARAAALLLLALAVLYALMVTDPRASDRRVLFGLTCFPCGAG